MPSCSLILPTLLGLISRPLKAKTLLREALAQRTQMPRRRKCLEEEIGGTETITMRQEALGKKIILGKMFCI
jgi:hypothetical protein